MNKLKVNQTFWLLQLLSDALNVRFLKEHFEGRREKKEHRTE